MKTVHADFMNIREGRQRATIDSDGITKLAGGIKEVGLLHAVVLEDDEQTLVAGERRTHAMKLLHSQNIPFKYDGEFVEHGQIPFTTLGECDQILLQKAELLENALRLDLSWSEKDNAVLKIKTMCELKAGGHEVNNETVAIAMLAAQGNTDPTYDQTRVAKDKVSSAELRSQYGDDPRVQKAKSAKEADRIIKKDLQEKHREKLSEQFKEVETKHTIACGDCCELIKQEPDNHYDVVLSDPIYGINAHEMHMFQRAQYNKEGSHHLYDDSIENWDRMFEVMPTELYRVTKERAAVYLFCDISRFFDFWAVRPGNQKPSRIKGLASRLADAGFTVWPRPLVWYKGNIGSLPKPEEGPRYTTEYIIFATKGEKKTTGVYHDVINIPQQAGQVHAAGKPPEVYHDLLRRSANPGDRVLDFNAGSFPILPAANTVGCTVTAWELDEKWIKEAHIRKSQEIVYDK